MHGSSPDPQDGPSFLSLADTQHLLCPRVAVSVSLTPLSPTKADPVNSSGVPLGTGSIFTPFPRLHDVLSHQQAASE